MFPLHLKDFYKVGHVNQYPKNTELVYSTWIPRSAKHFNSPHFNGGVVTYGMQAMVLRFLIKKFNKKFFKVKKQKAVAYYERRCRNGGCPIDTSHIEALHDLGYLPIEIKALPEGTLCPIGIPMLTIKNTLPDFGWLTNDLETLLSVEMWKPSTVATIAYEYVKLSLEFAERTCDNNDHVLFQNHDFSMRGMSGANDAASSCSGHLLSSLGTDTLCALDFLEKYYGANSDKEFIGGSVPATEHSVMCMGSQDGEQDTVERLLTEVYPTGFLSCVLDTWDFFKVLTEMLPALKDKIMARDGKFVVRPDSGDPVKIITGLKVLDGIDSFARTGSILKSSDVAFAEGLTKACGMAKEQGYEAVKFWDKYYDAETQKEVSEAEVKGAIELLWETFGGEVNSKNFKVLASHIGLIYGDSITLHRALQIYERLEAKGFASSNVVLGIGSFTYQMITRDTLGFAMKATYGVIDGSPVELLKDPATDDGTKKSLTGLIQVYKEDGTLKVKQQCTEEEESGGELQVIFKDGKLTKFQTLEEIRKRLWPTT